MVETGDEDDTYMYSSDDDEEEIFLKEMREFKKKVGYFYDCHGAMIVRRRHTPWKISKRVAVTSSTLHLHLNRLTIGVHSHFSNKY